MVDDTGKNIKINKSSLDMSVIKFKNIKTFREEKKITYKRIRIKLTPVFSIETLVSRGRQNNIFKVSIFF